jgi:hypothetical protein
MVFLGVDPRSLGVILAEGLCDLRGSLRLKASVMGGGAWPFFHYAPTFAFQLRKARKASVRAAA